MGSSRYWYRVNIRKNKDVFRWKVSKYICGYKVLKHNTKKNSPLPTFSKKKNTIYFRENSKGKVDQMRIFVRRKAYIDIDWGHQHDGIPIGTAHMHRLKFNKKTKQMERVEGSGVRLTPYMIKRYGKLILAANPNVVF